MTIKPKKKVVKDKNDTETTDSLTTVGHPHNHGLSHQHGHYHHSSNSENRLEKTPRVRTSPTRWLPSTSGRDDLSHSHSGLTQTLSSNATYEFDGHEPPSNHKRRHRSSPHRTIRKHRNNHVPNPGSLTSNTNNLPHLGTNVELEECDEDYNSEDEHSQPPAVPENINELEQWFEKALKEKKGFIIKKMGEDGACLFRAVADQVYGDQEMHGTVRKHCLDYMSKNADFYSQYVTEDFTTYINRKRMDSCHGNHLEIQAITELFNRPVEVYQYSLDPMNTFDTAYKTDNPPIRLSYHGNVHYNSIVDPYAASIGVGLGLPGLQPGLAERTLMHDAIKSSETFHIEQTMLEDKLRETDWEVTQESIDEQVARESYLQWLREQEKATRRSKGTSARTASATCSSSSDVSHNLLDTAPMRSPRQLRSGNSSPQQQLQCEDQLASLPGSSKSPRHSPPDSSVGGASANGEETGAVFNNSVCIMDHLPPTLYGLSDWSEEDILAQVIAQSQQEYLDSLKKRVGKPSTSTSNHPSTSASSSSSFSGEGAGCSGASTSTSYNKHAGPKS